MTEGRCAFCRLPAVRVYVARRRRSFVARLLRLNGRRSLRVCRACDPFGGR